MLLFVGLGNPGTRYAGNRHNIGFMAVDAIARRHGTTVDQLKAWNNLKSSTISVGVRLVVQPPRPANAQQ